MTKKNKINKLLKNEPDPAFKRRAKIILNKLNLSKNQKILDLGCGRGFYLNAIRQLNPLLELTGLDINPQYLKIAKQKINTPKIKLVQGNATSLPFKSNYFDQIIASEILEHIKNDQRAIKEIYRVLKPGGKAIVTVPNKNYPFLWDPLNWILERFFNTHIPSSIWWLAGIWADHQRLYTEKELNEKFIQSKFKILDTWKTTHYCLPFSHFLLYGIGKNIIETGFCPGLNRYRINKNPSLLNTILTWPFNVVDKLNRKKNYQCSVNIILKIKKYNTKY